MTLTLTLNSTLNDIRRSLSVIHTRVLHFSLRAFARPFRREKLPLKLSNKYLSALILINPRALKACLCHVHRVFASRLALLDDAARLLWLVLRFSSSSGEDSGLSFWGKKAELDSGVVVVVER